MRIVGHQQRDEFDLDPKVAWVRGRRLDAMLKQVTAPRERAVRRMTHQQMNQADDQRALDMARRINRP